MQVIEHLSDLQGRLALARAEEAEALRRAHHLRAIGSRGEYLDAMRNVDASHHDVVSLQRQLDWRRSAVADG